VKISETFTCFDALTHTHTSKEENEIETGNRILT